jgi:hypothetical protein
MKLRILTLTILIAISAYFFGQATSAQSSDKNLAIVAASSTSARFGATPNFLNDGLTPAVTAGMRTGGNRPSQRLSNLWVQYDWTRPVTTNGIAVYW